jgi:hypothetical protein
MEWPKTCNVCGLVHTSQQWDALPYVGPIDDGTEVIEMRNCPCGNTMAITIGPSASSPAGGVR